MKSAAEPLVFRGWSLWGLRVMARSVAVTWKATGNHGQEDFQRRTWQVPPGCVGQGLGDGVQGRGRVNREGAVAGPSR